jgi:hypothetical protein
MEARNEDYPRKNWSSLMLINCAHFGWRQLTPEAVAAKPGSELHQFAFLPDDWVGELPKNWNWLPQEYGQNPEAKLVHYTTGIPAFPMHAFDPMADEWAAEAARITHCEA